MNLMPCVKAMKNNTNEVVSARVQTYTFDNGELKFSIDHGVIKEAIALDDSLIDSLVGIALKTLIHRTTSRPKGNGEDATEWMIEAISGGAQAGRFRVTTDDKDRAATAMKGYTMAPEQTEKQFLDKYGVPFQNDADWLAKHYMGVRAAVAAAAKAAKSMI
jgi:hypothetical protein